MKRHFLTLLIICMILLPLASAVCTLTLDKETYSPTETATAEISCSSATEKGDSYTVNWTNQSGYEFELDTGTTPSTTGQTFYETYTIPSNWPAGTFVNATISDPSITGSTDSANVTGASASSLVISGATVGGKWLGLTTSIKGIVKNNNGKKVSGGQCNVYALNNGETQVLGKQVTTIVDGMFHATFDLGYNAFSEGVDYTFHVHCICTTNNDCVAETDGALTNTVGTTTVPYTTNTWITFNEDPFPIVYANGTDWATPSVFAGHDRINWHRNATNNYGETLKTTVSTYLVAVNDSGKIYGIPNEGASGIPERTFGIGNTTITFDHLIAEDAPTGLYKIRLFFDVFFNNIDVAQYIVDTETFNVTAVLDTIAVNSYEIRNIFNNPVDLNSSLQSLTSTPIDGSISYLTIGEHGHICFNLTNNYGSSIEIELHELTLHNPTEGTSYDISDEITQNKKTGTGVSCFNFDIPDETAESSDWHIMYTGHIGEFGNLFECGTKCDFSGMTDYFWIRKESGRIQVDDSPEYPIIRYFGDWRFFEETIDSKSRDYFRAKINISELHESDLDPDEKITDNDWDLYAIYSSRMPCTIDLFNYTVLDASGNVVDNEAEAKALQWFENGELIQRCALGIENINLSDTNDDYFEVRVWFNNLEERQTEALEGINNKTGTFHLDVACPSEGQIGGDLTCDITAQVEDSQIVQKEVDFTCYIINGSNIYSSINFNQMVTQTSITIEQEFPVPSSFVNNEQYTLQCYADYYNFGSRRDSFYDTFVAKTVVSTSSSSGGGGSGRTSNESRGASITGGAIDEGGGSGDGGFKIGPIDIDFGGKGYLVFIGVISLLAISALSMVYLRKKKLPSHKDSYDFAHLLKIAFSIIIILVIIASLFYAYKFSAELVSETQFIKGISNFLLKDNFIRVLVFIAFIILMVIILFRTLNIRGEIKFGDYSSRRRNHEDKKATRLQKKLNHTILKNELKQEKAKKFYRVGKLKRKPLPIHNSISTRLLRTWKTFSNKIKNKS